MFLLSDINKGMRKHIAQIIVAAIAGTVTPAMAWGEREQGILSGIAGAIILNRMLQPQPQQIPPPVYYGSPPPVVYYNPPPVYYYQPHCYSVPYYDSWGRIAYYRQICR